MTTYIAQKAWLFAWRVISLAYRNGVADEIKSLVHNAFDFGSTGEERMAKVKQDFWDIARLLGGAFAEVTEGELNALIEVAVRAAKANGNVAK